MGGNLWRCHRRSGRLWIRFFFACVVVVATGTFSQTEPTVVLLTRATDAQDRCVLNAGFISVQCRDDTVRSSPLHPQQPWQVSKQPMRLVRFQLCFRSQLAFRTRTRAQPLWSSCKARHVVRYRSELQSEGSRTNLSRLCRACSQSRTT